MDGKDKEIFEKFEDKYQRFILPKCEKLDLERSKMHRNYWCVIIIYVALVFYVLVFCSGFDGKMIIWCVFMSLFPPFFYMATIRKKLANKAKHELMNYFCASFEDLRWIDKKNYASYQAINSALKNIGLFEADKTSEFEYDDIFRGVYNDISFEIFDLCAYIYEKRANGKRKRTKVFSGAIIRLKLGLDFRTKTIINLDNAIGFKPETSRIIKYGNSMVYTEDRQEAKYLTNNGLLIEKLPKFKECFYARNVSCSFYKGDVWLGIDSINLFEITNSLSHSFILDAKDSFEDMIKQILCIYELIDYLKEEQKVES